MKACTNKCRLGKCLPVLHNNEVFQCARSLSDYIGVSREAIYQALSRHGSTDMCGKPRGGRMGNCKMIIVGKYSWPSVSAMARETGAERSTICKQLKRNPQKVLALVMQWEREKEINK